MRIKRRIKNKIIYLHGYREEYLNPKDRHIYNTIAENFNCDFANISSNGEIGVEDFKNIDFSKYSCAVGFSIGGAYASCIKDCPVLLINPGFGPVSLKYPDLKPVEDMVKKHSGKNKDQTLIIQGEEDKYFGVIYPATSKIYGKERIVFIPGMKHIPTKEEIEKYIVSIIKTIVK